jgi:hypothetical protein
MHPLGHLPPHARLVVTLTQRTEVREPIEGASIVLGTPGERARFLLLARELGVEGLVLSALRQLPASDRLPADVVSELDARWEHLRRQALVWDLERERVLRSLQKQGISPVLLKGSALRELVYHEPAERSMGDLDLLVGPSEIDPAVDALRGAGYASDTAEVMESYRFHHFHYRLTHPRGFIVELHWALSVPVAKSPLDQEAFLARATTSHRGNNLPVRVPSPEDLLLHVASQNEDDAFGLLRRVADVDRILAQSPRIDAAYVAYAARRGGLDVVLAVSLRLSELMLHAKVPAGLADGAELPWTSRFHVAMLQPVSWVVSLPSARRDAAAQSLRIWSAMQWSRRAQLLAAQARGQDELTEALAGTRASHEGTWKRASTVLLRLAKLAAFHVQVYSRSGAAALTPSGRSRLRFWRRRPD